MFSRVFAASAVVASAAALQEPPREGMRLIAFNETSSQWMTPDEIDVIATADVNFRDITNWVDHTNGPALKKVANAIPTTPRQNDLVNRVINSHLCRTGDCTEDQWPVNQHLASYFNRYYTTQDSVDAVRWLEARYSESAGSRLGRDVTIAQFAHSFAQPSLIVKMIGTERPDEVIVIGGHIDSIAGGAQSLAPGFDDDASGSSTVYSVFKNLIDADYRPSRTLEFHAYAAEEVGLRGSADVASAYRAQGVNVLTMTQFDMTCYSPNKKVGLTADFTDPELTNFLSTLLDTYTGIEGERSVCGYGCSDHASFMAQGYPGAFPFEARFGINNPNIHTTRDTEDKCDREYMGEMTKLAVAYAIEMATL